MLLGAKCTIEAGKCSCRCNLSCAVP